MAELDTSRRWPACGGISRCRRGFAVRLALGILEASITSVSTGERRMMRSAA